MVVLSSPSHYEIFDCIGQGHHGQVYHAIHTLNQKHVALKFLDHHTFPTHRFLRELNCLLSLRHPNILTCHGFEHHDAGRYLVMDYCPAGNLRHLMSTTTLSLEQKLTLIQDVLKGLEYAHDQGIVHCDIKPENILIEVHQHRYIARIGDFGIARIRHSIAKAGTPSYTGSPAYMAPERYYGEFSSRADLYAVGIILFELLEGCRPFNGTPGELMIAHMNQRVKIPDSIPFLLRSVLTQSLNKLPQRRFASARHMIKAIDLCKAMATATSEHSGDPPFSSHKQQ